MSSEADKLFMVIGYLENQGSVSDMMALVVRDAVTLIEKLEEQRDVARQIANKFADVEWDMHAPFFIPK